MHGPNHLQLKAFVQRIIEMISPQKCKVILRNKSLQDQDLKHLSLKYLKEH